jgi:hypothetical protein
VAVLEALYQSVTRQEITAASLPAPEEREQRQLEAPQEKDEAEAA